VLTWPDYAVLIGSLIVLLAIGTRFAREQRDTVDFFLARRQVPWWAACLSFLATEVSAVTIISVPATAYSENWEYAQFFVGSSLAKLAVAFLFIPAFYRHNVTTIYEFLLHRFGQASQVTASIFFFITRLAGSGVRLTVTAVAVAHLLGWSLLPTLAIFVVVSIVYIAAGGVKPDPARALRDEGAHLRVVVASGPRDHRVDAPGPHLLRGSAPGFPPPGLTPGPRPRIHPSATRA